MSVSWSLRHARGEPALQILDPVAGQGRDHHHRLEPPGLVEPVGERQQRCRRHQIDLVERRDGARLVALDAVEQPRGVGVDAALRVDQRNRQIGVARAAPGGADHGAVQPAARRENAGRID
jgi:hypothetical protein